MYTQNKYLALYALEITFQFTVTALTNAYCLLQRMFAPRTYIIFDHNETVVAVINDQKSALSWKAKGFRVFKSVKNIHETQHVKFRQI